MPTTLPAQNGTDKAVRLIDYLTAVALLRSKVIRTIDQYDKVSRLDDTYAGSYSSAYYPKSATYT